MKLIFLGYVNFKVGRIEIHNIYYLSQIIFKKFLITRLLCFFMWTFNWLWVTYSEKRSRFFRLRFQHCFVYCSHNSILNMSSPILSVFDALGDFSGELPIPESRPPPPPSWKYHNVCIDFFYMTMIKEQNFEWIN